MVDTEQVPKFFGTVGTAVAIVEMNENTKTKKGNHTKMKTINCKKARSLGACEDGLSVAVNMTVDEIINRWPVWAVQIAGCDMSPEQLMMAVQRDGHAIVYMTAAQRTPAICMAAVRRHGEAIRYLSAEERTPAVCLAAVRQDAHAIALLTPEQQTEALCLAAAG